MKLIILQMIFSESLDKFETFQKYEVSMCGTMYQYQVTVGAGHR